MDEPTTHLDLVSIDALIVALSNYGGSLVFISHDVNFIRKLGNNVWHIKDGNLTKYAGDYDYYLEKSGGIADARAAITNWAFLWYLFYRHKLILNIDIKKSLH